MKSKLIDDIDLALLQALQEDAGVSKQALAERFHLSPPTCLRRIKRLTEQGLIEKQVALLSPDKLAPLLGHGLIAIVELTLERQDDEAQTAFEQRVATQAAVQQCYRVSPGPDFVLVVHARDMPDYLALVQRLFTAQANVRNVKSYFSLKRSKFGTQLPLPAKRD